MNICYYLKPGIRTREQEARLFENNFKRHLILKNNDGFVYMGDYPYVSIIRFVFPLHTYLVYGTRRDLERLSDQFDFVMVMAHSFGTWLITQAILNSKRLKNNLVLCFFGGIVKCSLDFRQFSKKVLAVYNFCSTEDDVVHFLPRLVGRGSCGYYGFRYSDGRKANVNISEEMVWVPGPKDHFPMVHNIHENELNHEDWIQKIDFVERAREIVLKYLTSCEGFANCKNFTKKNSPKKNGKILQ